MSYNYTNEEILSDIFKIKNENNGINISLYEKLGKYPLNIVREFYGTFKNAVNTAEDYFFDKDIIKATKKKSILNITDLCDIVDASPKKVRQSIARLMDLGYGLNIKNNKEVYFDKDPKHRKVDEIYKVPLKAPNNILTFAVVSDTHLCSDHECLDGLKFFYQMAHDIYNVTDFFHAGDLVAGINMFRGQEAEVKGWGGDKQVDYVVEHYPEIKGCTTHFITGNHDHSFYKSSGIDIGKSIARRRKDLIYLGPYSRTIQLGNLSKGAVNILLHHLDKVPSKILGQPIQEVINKMPEDNKPDFLFCGHLHQSAYVHYKGVHGFMAGCFERSNEWLKRKILHPTIGGYIIQVGLDCSEIRIVSPTFIHCATK